MHTGVPGLIGGWHIRYGGGAPGLAHHQSFQFASLDLRQQRGHGAENKVHLSANQVCQGRCLTLVGHMQHIDATRTGQQFSRQLRLVANACRCKLDGTRIGLGRGHQFSGGFVRRAGWHHQ